MATKFEDGAAKFEARETRLREAARASLTVWQAALRLRLDETPRGSGQAPNEYDHLQASIAQIESAKRVLWMEDR